MGKRVQFEAESSSKRTRVESDEEQDDDLDLDIKQGRKQKEFVLDEESSGESDDDSRPIASSSWQRDRQAEEDALQDEEEEEKFEPFNMKQEEEEGYFDSEGNYVRKRDADDSKDDWLNSFTKQDIQKAKMAKEKRLSKVAEAEQTLSLPELQLKVLEMLKPGENVYKAIRRLGKESKLQLELLTENCSKLLERGELGKKTS